MAKSNYLIVFKNNLGDNALSRAKVNIVGKLAHELLDSSVEKLGAKIVFHKLNVVNIKTNNDGNTILKSIFIKIIKRTKQKRNI